MAYLTRSLQAVLLHCRVVLLPHGEGPRLLHKGSKMQWVSSVSLREKEPDCLASTVFPGS